MGEGLRERSYWTLPRQNACPCGFGRLIRDTATCVFYMNRSACSSTWLKTIVIGLPERKEAELQHTLTYTIQCHAGCCEVFCYVYWLQVRRRCSFTIWSVTCSVPWIRIGKLNSGKFPRMIFLPQEISPWHFPPR